jgi:hypothetical protein
MIYSRRRKVVATACLRPQQPYTSRSQADLLLRFRKPVRIHGDIKSDAAESGSSARSLRNSARAWPGTCSSLLCHGHLEPEAIHHNVQQFVSRASRSRNGRWPRPWFFTILLPEQTDESSSQHHHPFRPTTDCMDCGANGKVPSYFVSGPGNTDTRHRCMAVSFRVFLTLTAS